MATVRECGIDVGKPLPQDITFKDDGGAVFPIVFGLVFGGFFGLAGAGIAQEVPSAWLIMIPFWIFALAIIAYGVRKLAVKRVVHVLPDRVDVEDHGLFGGSVWSAPYTDFDGVLNEVEIHSSGSGNSRHSYAVYTVKLRHPDPARTVTLHQTLAEDGHRARWEQLAAFLQLPALEATAGGGAIARDVADLDKSVADLIAEGKLAIDEDALRAVPRGFLCRRSPEGLRVAWARRFPWAILVFGALFTAIPAWFGYFARHGHLVPRIAAPVLGTFFVVLLVMVWLTRHRLTVTRREVVYEEELVGRIMLRKSLPVAALESVRIDRLPTEQGRGVLLVTDADQLQVGTGLPEPTLEWLLAVILSAVGGRQ